MEATEGTIDTRDFIRWDGWTLQAQIDRLLLQARLCKPHNPEQSTKLLRWAEHLKKQGGET